LRLDVNSASDSVKDPMDRYHREPTLAELLSDPATLAVMDADGVDRYDLAATLSQMAAKLMRPLGPVEKKSDYPTAPLPKRSSLIASPTSRPNFRKA
jgi:hypothetical protein